MYMESVRRKQVIVAQKTGEKIAEEMRRQTLALKRPAQEEKEAEEPAKEEDAEKPVP